MGLSYVLISILIEANVVDVLSGDLQLSSSINDSKTKMTEVQQETSVSQHVPDYLTTPISIKLDGTNYALWSQVVEMYIAGRDKLGYINGELTILASTDPSFQKW